MLVLSRRDGEEIEIGEDITIRIVGIGRYAVRLGITAPRDQRIVRSEIVGQPGAEGDGIADCAEGRRCDGETVRDGGSDLQHDQGREEETHAASLIPPVPQLVERIRALEGQL